MRPSNTARPTATQTPVPTATRLPSITPTFDAASVVKRTPAPPAVCPEGDPNLTPDFQEVLSVEFPRLEEPILDFLNAGGMPQAVIKALEWTDQQGLEPDYSYDSAITSKAEFNRTHLYEADLTGDSVSELIVSRVNLYIFGCGEGKYKTLLSQENDDWSNRAASPWIVATSDMNLDGIPEIVVKSFALKLWALYRVFEWSADGYKSLLVTRPDNHLFYYPDVAAAEMGEMTLQDTDSNRTVELVIRGYDPFPNGLPSRGEEYTYMWNGEIFAYFSLEYSPPQFRFEAIQDGDRYSLAGNYEKALAFYQDAIFSDKLDWWSSERNRYEVICWATKPNCQQYPTPPASDPIEYPNLAAYAQYRIMLLHLLRGYLSDAQTVYNTLQSEFPASQPGHAYAEMATAFWDEYQTSQSMGLACGKAIEYATAHPVEILAYLGNGDYAIAYFGEQSLDYEPEDVCPFDQLSVISYQWKLITDN